MRNLRSAGRLISLICDICLDHGTYQGTEDDGEEVQLYRRFREAPQKEGYSAAPHRASEHDPRVWVLITKVTKQELTSNCGGVEKR